MYTGLKQCERLFWQNEANRGGPISSPIRGGGSNFSLRPVLDRAGPRPQDARAAADRNGADHRRSPFVLHSPRPFQPVLADRMKVYHQLFRSARTLGGLRLRRIPCRGHQEINSWSPGTRVTRGSMSSSEPTGLGYDSDEYRTIATLEIDDSQDSRARPQVIHSPPSIYLTLELQIERIN